MFAPPRFYRTSLISTPRWPHEPSASWKRKHKTVYWENPHAALAPMLLISNRRWTHSAMLPAMEDLSHDIEHNHYPPLLSRRPSTHRMADRKMSDTVIGRTPRYFTINGQQYRVPESKRTTSMLWRTSVCTAAILCFKTYLLRYDKNIPTMLLSNWYFLDGAVNSYI